MPKKQQLQKLPDNEIIFYQTADGGINVEVMLADENIWLTQRKINQTTKEPTENYLTGKWIEF